MQRDHARRNTEYRHFFLHLGKLIKAGQVNQNKEYPQMETYPTTEELRLRSSSVSEHHRPAYKVP